jgi:hypothetical protein
MWTRCPLPTTSKIQPRPLAAASSAIPRVSGLARDAAASGALEKPRRPKTFAGAYE